MDHKSRIRSALRYIPEYLSAQLQSASMVGVQVAACLDGEVELEAAFGHADLETGEELSTLHRFRVASQSKTFTAVACMQLVEEGRLRLDDRLGSLLPELSDSPVTEITVRELLSHGSGLARDGAEAGYWELAREFLSATELLDIAPTCKVLERNEHFKYSNVGFSLLGQVVQAVAGVPFQEYASTEIIEPIGLANTAPDYDPADDHLLARGYTGLIHGPQRREIAHVSTRGAMSATGFCSTAGDLARYFQAHLEGDDRLLTDNAKRMMRQVQWVVNEERSYGLGLMAGRIGGRVYYGHAGSFPGHASISWFDPERRLSVSVLTNTIDGPADQLSQAILGLVELAVGGTSHTLEIDRARFEGRFATLWGLCDVVDLGGRLYRFYPDSTDPAPAAAALEVYSPSQLRVTREQSFGDYGELMTYTFGPSGRVVAIRGDGGATMVPAADFRLPDRIDLPTEL